MTKIIGPFREYANAPKKEGEIGQILNDSMCDRLSLETVEVCNDCALRTVFDDVTVRLLVGSCEQDSRAH